MEYKRIEKIIMTEEESFYVKKFLSDLEEIQYHIEDGRKDIEELVSLLTDFFSYFNIEVQ